MKITDAKEIRKALKKDKEYRVGAMQLIYNSKLEMTEDITILYSFARYYSIKNILTDNHLRLARKLLPKLSKKLSDLGGIEKLPIYNPDKLELKGVEAKSKKKIIKQIKKIKGLKGTPRPFQWEGISFIEYMNGRALVADDMGLGKTIQVLAWLLYRIEDVKKIVIVVPATLKYNWLEEIEKFTDFKNVQILSGRMAQDPIVKDIIIINYDIMSDWVSKLIKFKPDCIIMDECQRIINQKSARTKACLKLGRKCKHVIGLSGTPISNRSIEFYNIIKLIDKTLFPSKKEYKDRYCDPTFDGYSWNYNGSSNNKELHNILINSIMIRRLKREVLKELPEKVRIVIPIELKNRKLYDDTEKEFDEWLAEGIAEDLPEVTVLSKISALRKAVITCKLDQCIEWIEDYLESGNKLVVFTKHTEPLLKLQKHFGKKAIMINGSVAVNKRHTLVKQFQEDSDIRLFLGNLDACAEGITLTAASATLSIELGWSAAKHDQGDDRIDRIGQIAKEIFAYYIIARNTIEEDIALLLDKKRKLLGEILDGKEVKQNKMLVELMRNYKKRRLLN